MCSINFFRLTPEFSMAIAHTQENQVVVMEESRKSPLSAASSGVLTVDDKSGGSQSAISIVECHICMEAPRDPVATSCGHVFCWPCLGQWLRNSVKPCPVCRKLLSRNANVLSIHPRAGDAAARASASNCNHDVNETAGAGNVASFPTRPANPLLFVPGESGSNPESECSDSMAIIRAIHELVREKSRGRSLALERARLKHRRQQHKKELLRRTSELKQETKRMGEHIAQLERRLARANQQLLSGCME